MSTDKAVMEFVMLSRTHTNEGVMKESVKRDIEEAFDDIIVSVVSKYQKEHIPKLIICNTYNKYSTMLPVKCGLTDYKYYVLFDQHLNEINWLFDAFFFSNRDVGHDIWKLSYELFAEETLLSNNNLMSVYYGLNKVALGPFKVLEDEFAEKDFVLKVQQYYILTHEIGHWIFAMAKQGNPDGLINIAGNWADSINDIKGILCEVYAEYTKMYHDKEYIHIIEEQNDIIQKCDGIVEECFADAVAYAFIFAFVAEEYPSNMNQKLLAGQALFIVMMNLQLLAMHHMTVSEETFENSTSIRIGFCRNYLQYYFEDETELFRKMVEDTVIRYEERITELMLECFSVLEEREDNICDLLLDDDGSWKMENVFGLFDLYKRN